MEEKRFKKTSGRLCKICGIKLSKKVKSGEVKAWGDYYDDFPDICKDCHDLHTQGMPIEQIKHLFSENGLLLPEIKIDRRFGTLVKTRELDYPVYVNKPEDLFWVIYQIKKRREKTYANN